MPVNNVEIHQLGKKQLAIVFNRHALKALQHGGATGCQLTMGRKRIKLVFMRDQAFAQRLDEFKQTIAKEVLQHSLWYRFKRRFKWGK